jgi:hypothetical protein
MNIGIKYCGGCNSHFDRAKVLDKIIQYFKEDNFEYAKENNSYDIILVLNGCSRACADDSALNGKLKIYINYESDYKKAIDLIFKQKSLKTQD